MKDFIEVADLKTKNKICIPVQHILSFTASGGGTYIETYCAGKYRSLGFVVAESYDEIKTKIQKSISEVI